VSEIVESTSSLTQSGRVLEQQMVDASLISAFKGRLYTQPTRVSFSIFFSAPQNDWLSCEATQGKIQNKINNCV